MLCTVQSDFHCVKSVQIRVFFWSVFSCIWTEYGDSLRKSPYSVRMQENADQKKLRIWTFFTQCLATRPDAVMLTAQKLSFSLRSSSVTVTKSVVSRGFGHIYCGFGYIWSHLVTFTVEILNGKFHFLCSVKSSGIIDFYLVFWRVASRVIKSYFSLYALFTLF